MWWWRKGQIYSIRRVVRLNTCGFHINLSPSICFYVLMMILHAFIIGEQIFFRRLAKVVDSVNGITTIS